VEYPSIEGYRRLPSRIAGALVGLLQQKVRDRTAALERRNQELALLYESAAFLQVRQPLEPMCRGFLDRVVRYFGADAGSVRLLDAGAGQVHLVVQQGLPEPVAGAQRCVPVEECLCCRGPSPAAAVFRIPAQDRHLGAFSLHFGAERILDEGETALLETLARQLGTAIENMRLAAREREMAISEERNRMARGLHDSIAQGLNFLNLQVQMLDDSLRQRHYEEAAAIVPLLRAGVQESYEDVRELLQNFRSRLEEDDLNGALRKAVRKFGDQTGVTARFVAEGGPGLPFAGDAQLQILFIVQEALSNVRKHARADDVVVRVRDGHDFSLSISDNGVGFDAAAAPGAGKAHVGLQIMRERAQHIHADLAIESAAGQGTTVRLHVPGAYRHAA
jgi:two-component system nitrate/nitrite sensor histidine kinase NarX